MAKTTIRAKGQITLPATVRDALRAGEGDQLEFTATPGGDIVVRATRRIATDQAWFWTPEWLAGEREASEDINAGRVHEFGSIDDMLKALGEP